MLSVTFLSSPGSICSISVWLKCSSAFSASVSALSVMLLSVRSPVFWMVSGASIVWL